MCIEGEEKEDPMSIEREEAMMMEERQEAMAMTMEERQEAMTMKERQEAMMMEGAPIIVLRSVIDKHKFMVLEEVALHIPVIKARLKKLNTKLLKNKTEPPKKVFCDIEHGITKRSLKIVVKYMYNRLYPTQHSFDFEAEFLKLKPSSLILNLIQAAHSLKIKNLMDLICKRFAEKVMPDLLAIDSCNKPKPVLQNVAYPLKRYIARWSTRFRFWPRSKGEFKMSQYRYLCEWIIFSGCDSFSHGFLSSVISRPLDQKIGVYFQ